MKLTDLDTKLTETQLRFRCPACQEHYIVIPVGPVQQGNPPVWSASGTVENLTIQPSIDSTTPPCHWHGWIRDGQTVDA